MDCCSGYYVHGKDNLNYHFVVALDGVDLVVRNTEVEKVYENF